MSEFLAIRPSFFLLIDPLLRMLVFLVKVEMDVNFVKIVQTSHFDGSTMFHPSGEPAEVLLARTPDVSSAQGSTSLT